MARILGENRSAGSTRSDRIERVIQTILQRERVGAAIDDTELKRRFPRLMPELARDLSTARKIEAASKKANHQSNSASECDVSSAHDLKRLNAALKDYEVLERIERGGQGTVFKAVQVSTGRTVAIKTVLGGPLSSHRQRRRFAREVELVSRLRHPNIVTLFESGEVQGRHYFAMEFVDGDPIDDFVMLHHLPVEGCIRLFEKICQAVSHAHHRDVIHRDLKPANILVDLDGEPHILDFGLAKSFEDVSDGGMTSDSLSITGQVFGTLPYLSPEQARGSHEGVNARSDVYALGVLLYQLLTGAFPYPVDGDPVTVRENILSRDPASLRYVVRSLEDDDRPTTGIITDDLERIVLKALAKDQFRRYQSVDALADDLHRYLVGDAVEARADSSVYLLKKTLRKYRVHVAIGAAFVALLGISSIAVTVQWLQARADRDNARQVAIIAHSTLDDALQELEESIRPLAGGTEVRNKLLESVALKLNRLRPLVESDVEMEGLLATLREKQGDIAYAQGSHSDAADHFRAAFDIYQRKTDTATAGDLVKLDVARALRKLGRVSNNGEGRYGQAIDILETILGSHSDAIEVRCELAKTQIEYGKRLYDDGLYERAETQARATLGVLAPGIEPDIDSGQWTQLLAKAYGLEGRAQLQLGKRESAFKSLEEYLRIRIMLSKMKPADVELRYDLMLAYSDVGSMYRDAGRIEKARALFEQAVDIGDYLILMDPSVSVWKGDLYGAHDKLARLFLNSGNMKAAENHSETAVVLAEDLIETEPQNAEWRRLLGFAHLLRGQVRVSKEAFADAAKDLQKAVVIRRELAVEDPDNPALMTELARGLHWLGTCAKGLGQSEEALICWQEAHAIRWELFNRYPKVTNHVLDFIASLSTVAEEYIEGATPDGVQRASSDLADAERLLEEVYASGVLVDRGDVYSDWMCEINRLQDQTDD